MHVQDVHFAQSLLHHHNFVYEIVLCLKFSSWKKRELGTSDLKHVLLLRQILPQLLHALHGVQSVGPFQRLEVDIQQLNMQQVASTQLST